MSGSTFIAESDRSKLEALTSPDDLATSTHVDLECTTTIDFESVLGTGGVRWAEKGDPVFYSEEDGAALFKISEPGLAYVLEHIADFPTEKQADLRKLATFVNKYGSSHIYEYATF